MSGASEQSKWRERMNLASDRVARQKRDCLRLETRSLSLQFSLETNDYKSVQLSVCLSFQLIAFLSHALGLVES